MVIEDKIDFMTLITFLDENWADFVDACGSEEAAEETVEGLRQLAGFKPM